MVRHVDEIDLGDWYELEGEVTKKLILPTMLSEDALDRLSHDEQQEFGGDLPWSYAHGRWALRPGELTVWAGINGHGKSALTGQVALDLVTKRQRVCMASMEMKPATTLYRMTRQGLGTAHPDPDRVRQFHEAMDFLLWFYDQRGTVGWRTIIALGNFIAQKAGVKHLFIDSLLKLGIDTDDYNTQKQCINELSALAHDTGLHIHLIHHARKSNGEDHPLDKFSIKGAGEIMDLADNGVLVWRNKRKEREAEKIDPKRDVLYEPDVMLNVCKQRDGEWEGVIGLYFDRGSMQFVENYNSVIDYFGRMISGEGADESGSVPVPF